TSWFRPAQQYVYVAAVSGEGVLTTVADRLVDQHADWACLFGSQGEVEGRNRSLDAHRVGGVGAADLFNKRTRLNALARFGPVHAFVDRRQRLKLPLHMVG